MPRPRRAKVASNAPSSRVATFTQMSQSTEVATITTETDQTARRGRKKATAPVSEKAIAVKPPRKRARDVVLETEAQSGDLSALERLKRRRSGEETGRASGTHIREDGSLIAVNGTNSPSLETRSEASRRSTKTMARDAANSAASARHATPVNVLGDADEDLYGLSPQGERSQLELQKQIEKRRLSQGHRAAPSSALKAQPTPMHEASLLAFKNFRRRTRQPSILRTGRMSMLSTTQLGLDSDIEDFNPDDESTPLHLNNYASEDEVESAARTSSSRRRKLGQLAADVQMPRSSPPMDDPIDDAIELMRDTIDLAQERSSSPPAEEPDLPEYVPETAHNTQDNRPDDWDAIMAPPKSSSSLEAVQDDESAAVQTTSNTGPRRATRARHNSRVSLGKKDAPAKAKSRRPVLSTAALESLLPQRHNRRARRAKPDAFEIPSDSDAASDVGEVPAEDSDTPPSRSARNRNRRRTRTTTPALTATTTKKSRRTPKAPLAATHAAGKNHAAKLMTTKKTYGRQSNVSDKENEASVFDVDDADSAEDEIMVSAKGGKKLKSSTNVKQSEEMQTLKAKFAEVDDWEMDFESVEAGAEGSNWR